VKAKGWESWQVDCGFAKDFRLSFARGEENVRFERDSARRDCLCFRGVLFSMFKVMFRANPGILFFVGEMLLRGDTFRVCLEGLINDSLVFAVIPVIPGKNEFREFTFFGELKYFGGRGTSSLEPIDSNLSFSLNEFFLGESVNTGMGIA